MKMSKCKHCGGLFDISNVVRGWMANHSRWCIKNPKRNSKINLKAVQAMNDARIKSGNLNQFVKAKLEGRKIPTSYLLGKPSTFLGKRHSKKTKQLISKKARISTHRRLRKGMQEYKGIMMDSSWEVRLAKRLDACEIMWIRPTPLIYTDTAKKERHYFPDFYLPKYDLYLDPKNPHAFKVQKDKIDCLKIQYTNIVFLCSLNEIDNFLP